MSKKMYEETYIADIADKIREFAGTVRQYTTEEMSEGVEEVAVAGYLAGQVNTPLILPHSVSYGTDYIDGIIGDTDTLMLEAFTRTPIAGELFFFIAKTRKNDVVGVTAKVLGLQTNADGTEWVEFHVEDATLFHSGKEIDDLQEAVNGFDIPLHYNYAVTLPNVTFAELFNWHKPGNPYSNSFRASDFSRSAKLGEIFSVLFADRNQNKGYAFARVTNPLNSSGNVEFVFEQAMLFHNFEEIEELKNDVRDLEIGVDGLKTRTLKFTFDDGTTDDLEVYVK